MKRNSGTKTYDQITGRSMFVVLLAACFSLALLSCSSSSSPPPTVDAKVNQHLVYQHLLGKDAPLKPYQTALLNLSSLADDHLNASSGSGYHNLPYEITNAGKYKYCIPDEDTHLTQIELFDQTGTPVGTWTKGETCTAVPLVPGRYTMHVHLNTTESYPSIFMKPHDVKVTQTGTMKTVLKSVASSYDGQIPMNQFLNLKVESLTDVMTRNKDQGLKQGWRVSTPDPSSNAAFYQVTKASYIADDYGVTIIQNDLSLSPVTQLSGLDLIYFNQEQGEVSILQGGQQLVSLSNTCISWEWRGMVDYNGDYSQYRVCNQRANIISLTPDSYPVVDEYPSLTVTLNSLFKFTSSGTNFKLYDSSNNSINWLFYRDTWQWVYGSGTNPVNFNVKVRYGTTSGTVTPVMLANEVALFDGSYGPSGFPADTHYWIINADMKDFNDFTFDNPDQRIKTVIAGRGARAQLFQNPSFQGDSVYVSPPADGEMLMTGTDNALLNNSTVGSIRIEPNTNTISVNEYEYHVIVSANTCIGCDLRGFDASALKKSTRVLIGAAVTGFWEINFTDSDLSNALFPQNGLFMSGNFTRVNFNKASLSNNMFNSCNFTGTDFTKAALANVTFLMNPAVAFYNACPKFEYTDLTTVTGFDSNFPVATRSAYNADNWWNTQRQVCRPSIAYSKVSQDLFADRRLWQFVDTSGVDFSNMNLDGAVFAGSYLQKAVFKNASLRGTVFVKADLSNADLSGADLTGAHLEGTTLTGVDLHTVKTLSRAYLSGMRLNAPNLAKLDMSGAQMKSGAYTNWDGYSFGDFSAATIIGAYMFNTKLNGADLSDAMLSHVSWFGPDATGENAIMVGTHFEFADLPGLNLKKAHLQKANFTDAVLVNADLSTTTLDYSFEGTSFYQANLKGVNLSGANLKGATLTAAVISKDSGLTYLEVLDDPTINRNQYRYYSQAYSATIPPASTNGIHTCPNGDSNQSGNCGDISNIVIPLYWTSLEPPRDPDCTLRPAKQGEKGDAEGNVLECTSNRHKH